MTKQPNPENIITGNAETDAVKGWFVGGSLNESLGLRHTHDVEIKWGTHKAGDERTEWVTSEVRTTIAILISGSYTVMFRDRTISLSKPGDYVMWGEGQDHRGLSPQDSLLMTIRWPSMPEKYGPPAPVQ